MNLPDFLNYYTVVFIAEALGVTLLIASIGLSAGALLGFALGLLRNERINPITPLRAALVLFVEVGRRVPFLVLLFIVFFGLQISGWNVTNVFAATLAVTLRSAVYFAESVRSGIEAIPHNQWEAAETMNIGRFTTLRLIVLPQAWRVILAPATVLFIQLLKSTSIVSQVGVVELTQAAKLLNLRGYSAIVCFGTILVLYYLLAVLIAQLGKLIEKRLVFSKN